MRYILMILILSALFSCDNNQALTSEEEIEKLLEEDKWVVDSIEFPMKRIKQGIKFSEDKQVFNIDSQGKVIPTYNEIVYEINDDTLKIVDFKYEERFLYKRGTLTALIESANDHRVVLKVIHPKENRIVLKKENM